MSRSSRLLAVALLATSAAIAQRRRPLVAELAKPVSVMRCAEPREPERPSAGRSKLREPLFQVDPLLLLDWQGPGRYEFEIRDSRGELTWSCSSAAHPPVFANPRYPCLVAARWYRGPGRYSFTARVWRSRTELVNAFAVDGSERRLLVIRDDNRAVAIMRYRPSPAGVFLVQAPGSDPTGAEAPTFRLINGSEGCLHGESYFLARGLFERRLAGQWQPHIRELHRRCTSGSDRGVRFLPPGGVTTVTEHAFVSGSEPFPPGVYRFWISYCDQPYLDGDRVRRRVDGSCYDVVSPEFEVPR